MVRVRRDRGHARAARRRPVQRRRRPLRRADADARLVGGRRQLAGRPAPAHGGDRPGPRRRVHAPLGLRAPRRHPEPGPRHPAAAHGRPGATGAGRAAAARHQRRRRGSHSGPSGGRGERSRAPRGAVLRAVEHRPRRPVARPRLRRTAAGRGVRRRLRHRRFHQRVPGLLELSTRRRERQVRPAGRCRGRLRRRPRHRRRREPVRTRPPARHRGRAPEGRRRPTARSGSTGRG